MMLLYRVQSIGVEILVWSAVIYVVTLYSASRGYMAVTLHKVDPVLFSVVLVSYAHATFFVVDYRKMRQRKYERWQRQKLYREPPKIKLILTNKQKNAGYVYLVRRLKDGVYKVAQTVDPRVRIQDLILEYGPLEPIVYWRIENYRKHEQTALKMTKDFHHTEGSRRELRKMTARQACHFIEDFTNHLRKV